MKNLRLQYIDEMDKHMGSIARMAVRRKNDLAKVVNKRVSTSHQLRVVSNRTSDEVVKEKVKDRNQSFRFGEGPWYTKDGIEYDPSKEKPEKTTNYYKKKCVELQQRLNEQTKVRVRLIRCIHR